MEYIMQSSLTVITFYTKYTFLYKNKSQIDKSENYFLRTGLAIDSYLFDTVRVIFLSSFFKGMSQLSLLRVTSLVWV